MTDGMGGGGFRNGRPCLARGSLHGPTHGQRYGKHVSGGLAVHVGAYMARRMASATGSRGRDAVP